MECDERREISQIAFLQSTLFFYFFFVIEGTRPFRTFGCLRDRPLRAENFEAKLDELERNAPFADRKTPPKNGSLIEIAEAVAE